MSAHFRWGAALLALVLGSLRRGAALLALMRGHVAASLRWSVALLALVLGGVAWAHGGEREDVALTLDAVPPALADVRVELHETLAAQLVVENPGKVPLEVLGTDGVPFLRLSSSGAEANLAHPEWYRTQAPLAGVPASLKPGDPPRWVRVSSRPAWGWFDMRLRTESIQVPEGLRALGRPATLSRWRVPVRRAGVESAWTGTVRFRPPGRGRFEARMTSPAQLGEGVRVKLVEAAVPGLYVEHSGPEPLTVLGTEGEPFLEVSRSGVRANLCSPTWRRSGLAPVEEGAPPAVDPRAPPEWKQLTTAPRTLWNEVRALHPSREPPDAALRAPGPTELMQWSVPVRLGSRALSITGTVKWVPAPPPPRPFRAVLRPVAARAGEEVELVLAIQDARGRPVRELAIVHEQPLHLLMASEDLHDFFHVHPEPRGDGTLSVRHVFPSGGRHVLYADYQPLGGPPMVERLELPVEGAARPAVPLEPSRTPEVTVDGVRARARWVGGPLRAGEDLRLDVTLTDAATGGALEGLELFLGARAHFILIREGGTEFLHAHPMTAEQLAAERTRTGEATRAHPTEVAAHTAFPQAGHYKLWIQVQRRGQVVTLPLVLEVAPAVESPTPEDRVPEGAVVVRISAQGYQPARVPAVKGQPLTLAFVREDARNCGGEVVFPGLGLRQKLPVGRATLVRLVPERTGDLAFTCGMGMYRGTVTASGP